MSNYNQQLTAGISDSEFIRGDVPMTKEEIRILSLSKLQLTVDDCLLDVGAGTGSVSIEMARLLPESTVYAVEQKAKALELIRQNMLKFETPNIKIIEGIAPDALSNLSGVNKIFIGGSGGNMKVIIDWIECNCHTGSRVVINSVSLNTLVDTRQLLDTPVFSTPEIIQVSINRIEKLGNAEMFRPQSPIFIISTTRL
jgi:precorrin-6Y C5,15-methyltransferase (decarboxylating) CbiT subunit